MAGLFGFEKVRKPEYGRTHAAAGGSQVYEHPSDYTPLTADRLLLTQEPAHVL
jgi:hypothetical protein